MKKVGKYRLETSIGKGAYGEVFKGTDTLTGQTVAVKSVALKSLNRQLQKQLEVELNALKTVSSPYVIKLYDVIKTTNNVYMVMEHCGGGDLERYLAVHKRVEEPLAKRWLRNLLDAMSCLHASGIIHRDIKPANILLSAGSPDLAVVKLADFGFARFSEEQSLVHTVLGTPMFMAPEVLADQAYGYKVDVWGFGVLAYEIMVGTEAFQARTVAELKNAQTRGVTFPPNSTLSDEAKGFLRDVLVYDPTHRLDFEAIKRHFFFQHSFLDPDDYEVVENEGDAASPIATDFSFVEDCPAPLDFETIEDSEVVPAVRKGEEQALSIDYQVDLVATRMDLAAKYDQSGKNLLSFAILMNCLEELNRCRAKLAALGAPTPLTGKIASKLDETKGVLELTQAKLTTDDLSRSVLHFEDTGLQVDSRLLVTEASRLLQSSKKTASLEEKQRLLKDSLLFLTMACSADEGNNAAGNLFLEVSREYRNLLGASFRLS